MFFIYFCYVECSLKSFGGLWVFQKQKCIYHVNVYFKVIENTAAIFQYKYSLKEKKRAHKRLLQKELFLKLEILFKKDDLEQNSV